MRGQHDEREHERSQIVDGAVDDQCAEDTIRRKEGAEKDDHQRVEHAQSARHVTQLPGRLRDDERAGEREKPQSGRRRIVRDRKREERVEDQRGRGPVAGGDDELGEREPRVRHRNAPSPYSHRSAAAHDTQQHEGADGREQERAGGAGRTRRHAQLPQHLRRLEHKRRTGDEHDADREDHAREGSRPSRVRCGQSPPSPQSIANGATGEGGKSQRLTQTIGDERSESRACPRHRLTHVGERQCVVRDEDGVGQQRERRCHDDAVERHRAHRERDPGIFVAGELRAQNPQRRDRDRDGECWRSPSRPCSRISQRAMPCGASMGSRCHCGDEPERVRGDRRVDRCDSRRSHDDARDGPKRERTVGMCVNVGDTKLTGRSTHPDEGVSPVAI